MTDAPRSTMPEDLPGTVAVQCGTVLLDGPGGVAVAMTPQAAIETGHRLVAAGEEAKQQAQSAD